MTPREAFGVVDGAIARATNLPVSYVVVNEALKTLQVALDNLHEFENLQTRDLYQENVESEKIEPTALKE